LRAWQIIPGAGTFISLPESFLEAELHSASMQRKTLPADIAGPVGWRSSGRRMAHLRPQVITLHLQVDT